MARVDQHRMATRFPTTCHVASRLRLWQKYMIPWKISKFFGRRFWSGSDHRSNDDPIRGRWTQNAYYDRLSSAWMDLRADHGCTERVSAQMHFSHDLPINGSVMVTIFMNMLPIDQIISVIVPQANASMKRAKIIKELTLGEFLKFIGYWFFMALHPTNPEVSSGWLRNSAEMLRTL